MGLYMIETHCYSLIAMAGLFFLDGGVPYPKCFKDFFGMILQIGFVWL